MRRAALLLPSGAISRAFRCQAPCRLAVSRCYREPCPRKRVDDWRLLDICTPDAQAESGRFVRLALIRKSFLEIGR
jgi:hypothetical protein